MCGNPKFQLGTGDACATRDLLGEGQVQVVRYLW